MYKIDLHTHSATSCDGALTLAHYRRALDTKRLDYIAVTDHNSVELALKAQAELGTHIIVGEEVTTTEGEIIGLYLKELIPAGLSLAETVKRIKVQGGLVYVPHPFETVRKGIVKAALDAVAGDIDIVEVQNGRAVFQNRHTEAEAWAAGHAKPGAASSDAHGWHGWCKTYSMIDRAPTRDTLPTLLHTARLATGAPGLRGMLYPKFNRLRKAL